MTTYLPEFESQTDENAPLPWTNCTFASGAMLVDWWTWGQVLTSDIELRRLSGIPLHLGANFAALRSAILKLGQQLGVALDMRYSDTNAPAGGPDQMTWAQLRDHMAAGGFVVAAGDYKALRGFTTPEGLSIVRWQPQGDFGHAICVGDYNRADGTYLHLDPLGRGSYAGDRAPIEALWAFLYKTGSRDANERVTVAHGFAGTRPARPKEPATVNERLERLKGDAWRLRRLHPDSRDLWRSATNLWHANYGKPLRQEDALAGEVLFLRRVHALGGK